MVILLNRYLPSFVQELKKRLCDNCINPKKVLFKSFNNAKNQGRTTKCVT